MPSLWSDLRRGPDGALPLLLVLLTVVTGLVDATSYLALGHVFVANMTGNVVFVGFAIAGASGFSVWISLIAVGAFLLGSLGGGRLGARLGANRAGLLRTALAAQLVLVVVAVVVAAALGDPVDRTGRYVLVALLACGMGLQNATVRRLAVPELTTTVLTMTLTGIGADSALAGGSGSKLGRRSLSVAAMFGGALVGALLVLRVDTVAPLAVAAGVLAVTAITAHHLAATQAAATR